MKVSFTNYRKCFNGKYPVRGLLPKLFTYWRNKLWVIEWRGFGITIDVRKDWISDMAPNERDNNE